MTPLQKANRDVATHLMYIMKECDNSVGGVDINKLTNMCQYIIDNVESMFDDKTSRWIGYIQGCLSVVGVLNVEDERDYTRIVYHKAYEEMGVEKPKTITI